MKFKTIFLLMKLQILRFYRTAFFTAVDKGNIEIVKRLLNNDKIDINTINVFKCIYIFKIQNS